MATVSGTATVGGVAFPVSAPVILPAAGNPVVITDPSQNATFTSSPGFSTWPNHDGGQVLQNVFDQGSAFHGQTLTAYGLNQWSVAASMAAGHTAVVSYPATQLWLSQSDGGPFGPVSGMASLKSDWNVSIPSDPTGDWECAYDLWVQGMAAAQVKFNPIEIMVWVWNHGQTPAGTKQAATVTISGVVYDLWIGNGGQTYSFVSHAPSLTGTLDILALFNWMRTTGRLLDTDLGIFGLCFGFEICSTNGASKTFAVNNLTMLRT